MYKLLGARPYNFVDEKTQKEVRGVSLYLTKPFVDGKGVGEEVLKKSITPEAYQDIFGGNAVSVVGKPVDVWFDEYGKIAGLQIAGK